MTSWYGNHMGWWGFVGMGLGFVLFGVLLMVGTGAVVLLAAKDRQSWRQPPTQPQSATEILAARYARGEISDAEYRERLAMLCDPARR